jgi:hypothetical protein
MRNEPATDPQARSCGQNQEDYSVLETGVIIGCIFFLDAVAPQGLCSRGSSCLRVWTLGSWRRTEQASMRR